MDAQQIIYDKIIKEREDAEYEVFREKLMIFVNNRSAKVIQRWWRKIIAMKKEKKKV